MSELRNAELILRTTKLLESVVITLGNMNNRIDALEEKVRFLERRLSYVEEDLYPYE